MRHRSPDTPRRVYGFALVGFIAFVHSSAAIFSDSGSGPIDRVDLMLAGAALVYLVGLWRWYVWTKRPKPWQCQQCRYDLRDLGDKPICPECGRESSHADNSHTPRP